MSKELDEFYERYSSRIIAIDDTPLVKVMDGGKFKLLSIEEYEEMTNKLADLEAKLAESDELIENYKMGYTGKVWKKQNKEISILKSVVKDKDEIIDKLKKVILDLSYTVNNDANNSLYILEKNNELKQQLAEKEKDKISFAVEQLEKVKEKFISENWDLYDTADLLEQVCELRNEQIKFIDNQINVLRNNKDGIH